MQTFLPYPDYEQSAKCLDNKRLGKQRIETLQIVRACLYEYKAWTNHPITRMWRDHEGSLATYGLIICEEWRRRGFKDTVRFDLDSYLNYPTTSPSWLGDERVHRSHRSNLIRKDPLFYTNWDEPNDLPYFWPI